VKELLKELDYLTSASRHSFGSILLMMVQSRHVAARCCSEGTREMNESRYFHHCCLKANKVSKSEGTGKIDLSEYLNVRIYFGRICVTF